MTHEKNMQILNRAIYDAIRSGNREGAKVTALRDMAAEVDHIIDHGCTREEMRERIRAQRAVQQAGWTA
jgi:hypothetical protein